MIIKRSLSPRRPPTIRLERRSVSFVDQIQYQGILLDRKLTFLPHAKAVRSKAKVLFHKLTRIAKLKYGVKPHALSTIYSMVYLPIIPYVAPVWAHRVQNTHIKTALRAGQTQELTAVMGAYRTTSYQSATVILGHMPISLYLEQYVQLRLVMKEIIAGIKAEVKRQAL